MTDIKHALIQAASAAIANECQGDVPENWQHEGRAAVIAVLGQMATRPEPWNRYELADLADEIEERK